MPRARPSTSSRTPKRPRSFSSAIATPNVPRRNPTSSGTPSNRSALKPNSSFTKTRVTCSSSPNISATASSAPSPGSPPASVNLQLCHPEQSGAAFPFTPHFGVPRYAVEGPLFDPPVLSITMRRRICPSGGMPAAGRVFRPAAFVLARPADSLAVLTCVVLLVLLAVGLARQKNLQRQLEDMKQQIQRPVGQVAQPHTTAK